MITRFSSIYRYQPSGGAWNDGRSRVLINLCESKLSIEDISLALNCSEGVVRSLLSWPFRSFALNIDGHPEVIDLGSLPPANRTDVSADSHSVAADAPNREKLAGDLAIEVCQWLDSFEASDAERQKAIENAGLELDKNSVFYTRKYWFQPYLVTLKIVGLCRPICQLGDELDFRKAAGRWLAAWILFWIADPEIWDRALDLAYARFGEKAEAPDRSCARNVVGNNPGHSGCDVRGPLAL